MKPIFLLWILLSSPLSWADGFFRLQSTYEDGEKQATFAGVSTLLKYQERFFLLTVAHLSEGEKPKATEWNNDRQLVRFKKDRNGNLLKRTNNLLDLAVIEIENPGSQPLLEIENNQVFLHQSTLSFAGFQTLKFNNQGFTLIYPENFAEPKVLANKSFLSNFGFTKTLDHRGKEYLNYTQPLRIEPGMSGSIIVQQTENGRTLVKGFTSQYDNLLFRSYFTPVEPAIGLITAIITNNSTPSSPLIEWRLKNCQLVKYFVKEKLFEADFSKPSGSWGGSDGGGFGGADGGNPQGQCRKRVLTESKMLDELLASTPGFFNPHLSKEKQHILAYHQNKRSISANKQSFFFADPTTLQYFAQRPHRQAQPVSQFSLEQLLESRFHNSFSRFELAAETRVCENHSRHFPTGNKKNVVLVKNGSTFEFILNIEDCDKNKDQLRFQVSDSGDRRAGKWLALKVVSVGGQEYLVDLRNFWFSHPKVQSLLGVIQIKPLNPTGTNWWSSFSIEL